MGKKIPKSNAFRNEKGEIIADSVELQTIINYFANLYTDELENSEEGPRYI